MYYNSNIACAIFQCAVTESSGNTSVLGPDNNSDVKSRSMTPHSEKSELEKHQSYVAEKIIREASKLADDKDQKSVQVWHERAQQVVSIISPFILTLCLHFI